MKSHSCNSPPKGFLISAQGFLEAVRSFFVETQTNRCELHTFATMATLSDSECYSINNKQVLTPKPFTKDDSRIQKNLVCKKFVVVVIVLVVWRDNVQRFPKASF